jgi:hypothetical protein
LEAKCNWKGRCYNKCGGDNINHTGTDAFPDCKYRKSPEKTARERKTRKGTKTPAKPAKPASGDPRPIAAGIKTAPDDKRRKLAGKRFVFTAAQNNTYLHEEFWQSLTRFCTKTGAQLYVSRFTYNKAGWKAHGGVSNDDASSDNPEIWYDPRIVPYVIDEQVKVAQGLVFCGELDILPTAATPLATLSNYTGPNSGIVPHVKVQLQSLATMKDHDAKFMYTTGACTLRNYIERKAGQVATFHHVFGALLVEVANDGRWFARQLIADDHGIFYDIDTAYGPTWDAPAWEFGGSIVTLGDIHAEKLDYDTAEVASQMISAVQPSHIFLHDLIDFEPRNHHNLNDPHFLARQAIRPVRTVQQGMAAGVSFLHWLTGRHGCKVHVVRSNHDQAFERWLKETSAAYDYVNAGYWHSCNAALYHQISQGNDKFDVFAWAMTMLDAPDDVHFMREDESLVINDIEYGMHGHRGPNGARGNPKAFRSLGRKANTGHTHSASIIDGVWTAGVLARLDMGYNAGPSSWSHSHIVTYPNGKRQMITQKGDRWRA